MRRRGEQPKEQKPVISPTDTLGARGSTVPGGVIPLLCLILLIAVVGGLFGLAAYLFGASSSIYVSLPLKAPVGQQAGFYLQGQIPRMEWVNKPKFAAEVIERDMPIVFTNSPALTWPAMAQWGDAATTELARDPTVLRGVKKSQQRSFRYYNFGLDPRKAVDNAAPGFTELNATLPEFLKLASNSDDGWYHYFNGDVRFLGPEVLRAIQPTAPMEVHDAGLARAKNASIHIWMGSPGCTANLHFDVVHNFFVQVVGRKRITIVPPSACREVYLYPRLHHNSRQTQADYTKPINGSDFPRCVNVPAYETLLGPGEMLFIPPLWFHHIEALDFAVSISIWSHNTEAEGMDDAIRLPLPLESEWSTPKFQRAALLYLAQAVEAVEGKGKSEEVVKTLLATRYRNHPDVAAPRMECPTANGRLAAHVDGAEGEALSTKFAPRLAKLTAIFQRLPSGVREITLENWIEELAFVVVGKDMVVSFLASCVVQARAALEE